MIHNNLENIWNGIWKNNPQNGLIIKFWGKVTAAYSDKARNYHNLNHIEQMIISSIKYSDSIKDLKTLQLAIFYHDYIYSVKSKKNEEQSALIAEKNLKQLNYSDQLIKKCKQYIIATKSHINSLNNSDLNFLLDFDLEKLGASWPEYLEYTQQIRKEYKIYPDILYKQERKKVLSYFLNLENIYKTKEYIEKYEKIARQNLSGELDMLN